jgi:site-specific DNA-cytosine methylase
MNNIKWGSIIPLIGGFHIASNNVIQTEAEIIFSYKPFEFNDSLLLRYLKQKPIKTPYYFIEDINKNIINKYSNKINIICGVPPCSGISNAANRKTGTRGTAAPNDWMYKSANFILEHIMPDVYVFENAPGLYTNAGELVRENLINISAKFNYGITFYRTNTILHGVPQHRPRTYVIMIKNKQAPILNYYNIKAPTLTEYLKQIPKTASLQNEYFSDEPFIDKYEITQFFKNELGDDWRKIILDYKEHICVYNFISEMGLINKFKNYLNDNNGSEEVKKDIEHVIKKTSDNKNFRLSKKNFCIDKDIVYAIIGESMVRNIHQQENRLLNIRENMWLMGLPHDFELYNKKEFAKIPQNVPVATSQDIIKECIEIINGNREFSKDNVLMQNNIKHNEEELNIKLF